MRSWLFIPADSERKLARGLEAGADMVILDLEDSVAPSAKEAARNITAAFLAEQAGKSGRPALLVRVNALDTGLTGADVDAVMPSRPDSRSSTTATRGRRVRISSHASTPSSASSTWRPSNSSIFTSEGVRARRASTTRGASAAGGARSPVE